MSPPPYSSSTRPDWTQLRKQTLQQERRVQQKKKRPNPHHKQQQSPVSNHKQNKKNNTCETCDPTNLELSYISNNTAAERTLTPIHSCHRPRIPFGHVLIERRCKGKHCKKSRDGCVSNHIKKEQNVWDLLWPDEPRVVVYIQQHTTTEGAVATERERE